MLSSEALEFEVTDEDILLGVRGQGDFCPITRAATRALFLLYGRKYSVYTGWNTITVYEEPGVELVTFRHGYDDFVDSFDRDQTVSPFSGRAFRA